MIYTFDIWWNNVCTTNKSQDYILQTLFEKTRKEKASKHPHDPMMTITHPNQHFNRMQPT